jgi:esterase
MSAAKSSPRSSRVKANGINIHYLEWGDPKARPVVLLHGLRGHGHSWDDFSRPLSEQYRVLALDQRGRGETDWAPDGDYTTPAFAADTEAFCQALGLESFTLVGHSMGGRNGIMFAARNPKRVAAFVICDVGPDIQAQGAARIRQELLDAPEEFDSLDSAVARTCAENPLAPEPVIRRRVQYQTKPLSGNRVTWRYDPLIRDQIRSNTRPTPPDFWGMWSSIQCPVLIVRGAETDILAKEVVQRMLESKPQGETVEIARAAHMVFEDNPPEFYAKVSGWMAKRTETTAAKAAA